MEINDGQALLRARNTVMLLHYIKLSHYTLSCIICCTVQYWTFKFQTTWAYNLFETLPSQFCSLSPRM